MTNQNLKLDEDDWLEWLVGTSQILDLVNLVTRFVKTSKKNSRVNKGSLTRSIRAIDSELAALIHEHDPIELLTAASLWHAAIPADALLLGEETKITQAWMEAIQALVIYHAIDNGPQKLVRTETVVRLVTLVDELLSSITISMQRKAVNSDTVTATQSLLSQLLIQEELHIRNPGHAHQSDQLHEALYQPLDPLAQKLLGYKLSNTRIFLNVLRDEIETRARKLLRVIENDFNSPVLGDLACALPLQLDLALKEISKESTLTSKQINRLLVEFKISHSSLIAFTRDELFSLGKGLLPAAIIERLVDNWSTELYRKSDLKSAEQIVLPNEVRWKPLIKITPTLFLIPSIGTFRHNIPEIFETDPQIANSGIGKALLAQKKRTMETYTAELFRRIFPMESVLTNVKLDKSVHKKDGECDVLIWHKGLLIVCEVKAKSFVGRTEMGLRDSMKNTVRRLVGEPSKQCFNFTEVVHSKVDTIALIKDDKNKLKIDRSEIDQVIPIGVNLKSLGFWGSSWQFLKRAGFIKTTLKPLVSMSVFELDTVFEILEDKLLFVNYLRQRYLLEHKEAYVGDELDLLNQYDSGFLRFGKLNPENYKEDVGAYFFVSESNPIQQSLLAKN